MLLGFLDGFFYGILPSLLEDLEGFFNGILLGFSDGFFVVIVVGLLDGFLLDLAEGSLMASSWASWMVYLMAFSQVC